MPSVTDTSIAMRALRRATRLRLRGRPWSMIANAAGALAAGALSPDELRYGVADAWELYDPADLKNFELMAWEGHLIERLLPARAQLLVVGSGVGRDLVAYARLGFRVTGIEPAPRAADASIASLRHQQLAGTVINGFVEDVAIDAVADAVIFSYFCYAYIPCADRRIAVLKKLQTNITRGGVLAITYNRRMTRSLTPLTKLGAWISGSSWRPEDGDTVYLTGRPNAPFAVEHLFDDREIANEIERAGYRVTFQETVGEVCLLLAQTIDSAGSS